MNTRTGTRARSALYATAFAVGSLLTLPGIAQPLSGPDAKVLFLSYVTNLNDRWIDFEGFTQGAALQDDLQSQGVRFATTKDADGSVFSPEHHVVVVYHFSSMVICGTPYPGGGEDGQMIYEVRFTQPQRRAGIHRYWFNGSSLTRFHALDGTLLHEFTGTGFVAYNCQGADTNGWIARIEMDGQLVTGVRQVGYSDDLMFGTAAPPDPTPSMQLNMYAGVLLSGLKGCSYVVEYVERAGDTNAWQTLTNLVLPASQSLIFDLGSTSAQQRFYRSRLGP